MIEQLAAAKARHPGMVILFWEGNGYRALDEDAELLNAFLGHAEAQRAGFTDGSGRHTSVLIRPERLERMVAALVRAGRRVAVCQPAG
jgi:DNA mismatch repair protein MutS